MRTDRRIRHRFKARTGTSYPTICNRGGRQRLAELFKDLGYNVGVEVGVRMGGYSKVLCEANPDLQLYSIDPWTAFNRVTQEQQDDFYKRAVENLAPYNAVIIKKQSLEAVDLFEDRSLDFIHLDGRHEFDHIMMELILWTKKVRVGGIVSGHDYSMFPDVARAADAYVQAHMIAPWYLIREYESTFFWEVKGDK